MTVTQPSDLNNTTSRFPRASGILLHISSLPGPYGIGDIGPAARNFIDDLVASGQTYWQILPLGPTGFGDSPYQCLSSFAGNTNLISLDMLVVQGWLTYDEVADHPPFRTRRVEYGAVIPWHDEVLTLAYERFLARGSADAKDAFRQWCQDAAWWLEDFVLYIGLKEQHGGRPWIDWTREQAAREPAALEAARHALRHRLEEHRFRQWQFFTQWAALRNHANERSVRIIGDIPIFVGYDSADVWVNRDLFDLDQHGVPHFIAGVPPDSFSVTGQRWGNPLYHWDRHAATGYDWWIKRIDAALALVDVVRIDHFRGFDRYWQIPATDPTAEHGTWRRGPGRAFFDALGEARSARIIAEDLGDDLGGAIALRDALHLPGMMVLQFAFSGTPSERERFRPGTPSTNFIVYTGTHDNDTTLGWWQRETTPAQQEAMWQAVNTLPPSDGAAGPELSKEPGREPNWAMIRLGMSYAAHTFITPLQDVLGLGASARMNTPSVPAGNWRWRATDEELAAANWNRLYDLTAQFRRIPSHFATR